SNSHLLLRLDVLPPGRLMMGFQHSRTRYVPDLLKLRARIANHLGNRAEAMQISLHLFQVGTALLDFLEQLCAAAVESRLSVDRHGFETAGAGIEKLAGIGRHGLRFRDGAMRTGNDRFKDHGSS